MASQHPGTISISIDKPYADKLAEVNARRDYALEQATTLSTDFPADPLGGVVVEGLTRARYFVLRTAVVSRAMLHGAMHVEL